MLWKQHIPVRRSQRPTCTRLLKSVSLARMAIHTNLVGQQPSITSGTAPPFGIGMNFTMEISGRVRRNCLMFYFWLTTSMTWKKTGTAMTNAQSHTKKFAWLGCLYSGANSSSPIPPTRRVNQGMWKKLGVFRVNFANFPAQIFTKKDSWFPFAMVQRVVIDELGIDYFNKLLLHQIHTINEKQPLVWDAYAQRYRRIRVQYYASTADLVGHYERFLASVRFLLA